MAAAAGTAVVVSKPRIRVVSLHATATMALHAANCRDVFDKSEGRILAAPDPYEWPSRRLGSAGCAAGYPINTATHPSVVR
jgi:hypothetical protein